MLPEGGCLDLPQGKRMCYDEKIKERSEKVECLVNKSFREQHEKLLDQLVKVLLKDGRAIAGGFFEEESILLSTAGA